MSTAVSRRLFCSFSVNTGATKTALSGVTPSGDANPLGTDKVIASLIMQSNQAISFLFDTNTGTPFPLAANVAFGETASVGNEIKEIYISNASGSTATINIYFKT